MESQPLFTLLGKKLTMIRESAGMREFDIDGDEFIVCDKRYFEQAVSAAVRNQLVLFGAELSYCLANDFPLGKGHEPPSMVYESFEPKVDRWLKRKETKSEQLQQDN